MANKTLAFEIGTEELPAFDLHNATEKLPGIVADVLDGAQVPHGAIQVFTTPRRLITIVEDVPETTEATVEEFRGPSVAIAFDADGNPTNAAAGFARGKGVDVADLERRSEGDTEYIYAVVSTPAQDVAGLLPTLLCTVIESIPWPKSQRWGSRREQFSRPVRWILALLGDTVIPVEFAGLNASNITYGHRFLAPEPIEIAQASELVETLRGAHVVPSEQEREESIRKQAAALEEQTGLRAELPAHTLQEVVNLTEYPTVMVGKFDELFLAVPKEITVDAMLVHQRYFPLFNADGTLSNSFLITSNGNPDFQENIVDGNQRVVAARLYDAKFFYDEDLKQPLEAYVDQLGEVVFQESLGTMLQKTKRVIALSEYIAEEAKLSEQDAKDAARAAYLAKADLVTGAVVEFTSVQGIMGRYYAEAAGETDQVAQAIADHYRPKFAGDDTPESLVGKCVACADKLDTISGLFAVDQAPTGSSDPFALRRNALGIIAMLQDGLDISLEAAIDRSLEIYRENGLEFDYDAVRKQVIEFFITRTKVILRDEGISAEVVDAVLSAGVVEPIVIMARAHALQDARTADPEGFADLALAYGRANNLRDASLGTETDPSLFGEAEEALNSAIEKANSELPALLEAENYTQALEVLRGLRVPIDAFFEDVMVMDEDRALAENRLKLLNRFVEVFANVADFSTL